MSYDVYVGPKRSLGEPFQASPTYNVAQMFRAALDGAAAALGKEPIDGLYGLDGMTGAEALPWLEAALAVSDTRLRHLDWRAA